MDSQRLDTTAQCLTPREHEVLDLARRGYTNGEIADQLGITRNAVRFHLKEIHSKLGTGGERSRLGRGWRYGLGLVGLPLAKFGTGAAVTAIAAVLAAGGYLAYQEHPSEAFAAPEHFDGAVMVDGEIWDLVTAPPPETAQSPATEPAYELWYASVFGMPAGGAVVAAEETVLVASDAARGICAAVAFSRRGADHHQYHMTLDEQDITAAATWVSLDSAGGELCYAPAAMLQPGEHSLVVGREESWGGAFRALYQFTVTP